MSHIDKWGRWLCIHDVSPAHIEHPLSFVKASERREFRSAKNPSLSATNADSYLPALL